jgi:hypothetical protein
MTNCAERKPAEDQHIVLSSYERMLNFQGKTHSTPVEQSSLSKLFQTILKDIFSFMMAQLRRLPYEKELYKIFTLK